MKRKLISLLTLTLLFSSCVRIELNDGLTGCDEWAIFFNEIPINEEPFINLFIAPKYRLDTAVEDYYDAWKKEGKDTTKFVIDFAEIAPFEWDSLYYFWCSISAKGNTKELNKYVEKHNITRCLEAVHLLKNGKIVYNINLEMYSDNEKGSFFCTNKLFIKRSRDDAKFHVQKNGRFFIFRDMTEEYIPSWRYVYEDY